VILFAFATYLALLIETAVPLWFPYRALVPNLVLILTVDLGLRHHGAAAALMAFAMGYATDALAGTHLGLNALLTTMVYLLTYEVSSRLLVTNAAVGAIATFFAVIGAGLSAVAITSGWSAGDAVGAMFPRILGQAAISAIVAPPVFALMARWRRTIGLPLRLERE